LTCGEAAMAVPASLSPGRIVLVSLTVIVPRPAPSLGRNVDQAPLPRCGTVALVGIIATQDYMAQKCNVIERAQDLMSPNQWLFTADQGIVIHSFAVAAPRFNSSRAVMARKARRRSLLECP
jgi:hypothetical protein